MSESGRVEFFSVDDPDECASFLDWIVRVGEDSTNLQFIDELFETLKKVRKETSGGKKNGPNVCRWEKSVRKFFNSLSSSYKFSLSALGDFLRLNRLPSSLTGLTDQSRARLLSFISNHRNELNYIHVLMNFYYIKIALLPESERVLYYWTSSNKLKIGFSRLAILVDKWGKGIVFSDCVFNIWALGILKTSVFDSLVKEFTARILSKEKNIAFNQLETYLNKKLG